MAGNGPERECIQTLAKKAAAAAAAAAGAAAAGGCRVTVFSWKI